MILMSYRKAPSGHSEFGGGPGLIDPQSRKDRSLDPDQELMEIYASNPMDPDTPQEKTDLYAVPRPAPYKWPDKKTAKGTN